MHKSPLGVILPLAVALFVGLFFFLAFGFPAESGRGYLEAFMAFLFPVVLMEALFRGRALPWTFVSLLSGIGFVLYWVPRLIQAKGGLPWVAALPGAVLLWAWEAAGLVLVLWLVRRVFRRAGPAPAAFAAALGIMAWEAFGYHVYPWAWGSAFGGVPWMARSAAFLGTYGLSGLTWGCAAWAAGRLADDEARLQALVPAGVLFGSLLVLGFGWYALPRGPERRLDVVAVQPNYPPNTRMDGMMQDMWDRTDRLLQARGLPRPGLTTLVLWPESSVMGFDLSDGRSVVAPLAERRNVAWLFGTEGPRLNLVRGEAPGRPFFVQAKVHPMPFGERMPGPEPVREWLDRQLGIRSEVPGRLGPGSSFAVPTPGGDVRVHPLVCSEALLPRRVVEGLAAAGGDLLSNHTNDGWFDRSIATDVHAVQIRLRACETGLPLVRATLTGKSGIFRADGRWELWGDPLTEGAWALDLAWRPVRTPARWMGLLPAQMVLLALGLLVALWRFRKVTP